MFFGTTNAGRLSLTFTLLKRLPAQKDTMFKTLKLKTLFKTQDPEIT